MRCIVSERACACFNIILTNDSLMFLRFYVVRKPWFMALGAGLFVLGAVVLMHG
jgi:hypothetical protein